MARGAYEDPDDVPASAEDWPPSPPYPDRRARVHNVGNNDNNNDNDNSNIDPALLAADLLARDREFEAEFGPNSNDGMWIPPANFQSM